VGENYFKKKSLFRVTFAAFLELTTENKQQTEVESLIEKP
jgi:hypothetical protein